MAQFDVYSNSNSVTNKLYPLLVNVQYSVLSELNTRIVIPLMKADSVNVVTMDVLMPIIRFSDQQYVLMTPQISAVSERTLRKPIGTLEHSRPEVLAALDFAITGT